MSFSLSSEICSVRLQLQTKRDNPSCPPPPPHAHSRRQLPVCDPRGFTAARHLCQIWGFFCIQRCHHPGFHGNPVRWRSVEVVLVLSETGPPPSFLSDFLLSTRNMCPNIFFVKHSCSTAGGLWKHENQLHLVLAKCFSDFWTFTGASPEHSAVLCWTDLTSQF